MKKKIEVGTVIFIVIVAIVISCLATYMYLTSLMPSLVAKESLYDRISEVDKTIEKRYIGEVDKDKAMDALLSGYASGVDKYSTYLNEEKYAVYTSQMDGKYSGIGITVKYMSTTGLLKVIDVKNNSPAANADIKIGDFIYKIDDKIVSEISYEESSSLLRAENGTEMSIVIIREEKEYEKKLTVAEYLSSSVSSKILYGDVGYISITEFDNNTGKDFKTAVEDLISKGALQFVFDVRNNTGGSLTTVIEVLDFLLPEGNLVTLKDKTGQENVYTSGKDSLGKKFTVIINESTYSGGELFAAAIRDFNAGTLIGKTTYGKGYAQEIIPLSEGALYLSTKLYYTPNGENYEGVGVAPDKEVEMPQELEERFYELKIEEDPQLVAALEELGKTIIKPEQLEQTEEKE